MILGEEVLLGKLIMMALTVFETTYFKGYFSHSQTSNFFMLFLDSVTWPWTKILGEAIIFDTKHDGLRV